MPSAAVNNINHILLLKEVSHGQRRKKEKNKRKRERESPWMERDRPEYMGPFSTCISSVIVRKSSDSLPVPCSQLRSSYVNARMCAKLCPILYDSVDCSPPGSSVHGTSQATTLEWIAIFSSRESSRPRNQTCVCCIVRQILHHWATREAGLCQ